MESRPIQCGSRCRPKNCTDTHTPHQQIISTSSTNHFQTSIPLLKQTNNSMTTSLKPNPHLIMPHRRCCRDETPAARYTKTRKSSREKQTPNTWRSVSNSFNSSGRYWSPELQAPKKPGLKSGSQNSWNFLPTRDLWWECGFARWRRFWWGPRWERSRWDR